MMAAGRAHQKIKAKAVTATTPTANSKNTAGSSANDFNMVKTHCYDVAANRLHAAPIGLLVGDCGKCIRGQS